jgi:hypothetical protein
MYALRAAVVAVVAAGALTATGVRIGDHAPYVRVVVDFNRYLPTNQVELVRLNKATATVEVNRPGIKTKVTTRTGEGVRVALQPGTQALHIAMSFAPRRFSYVSYAVVSGTHLAIDLWKSAPPPGGSAFGTCGAGQWLTITNSRMRKGSVRASGTEDRIFENTFQVVVRGANGKVLGRRTLVHAGPWSTSVKYTASHRQPGTLEAVAFSAKDGALACLYEKRVTLPAS